LRGQHVAEPLVLRRGVGAELLGPVAVIGGGGARYLVPGDRDSLDLLVLDVFQERREGNRRRTRPQSGRELPDQDPHDDEDHPEQQALEGRIQPRPPNRLAFKNITARDGAVTRKSSATDSPTTHTIRSSESTTSGSESRSSRAILRSTRKSCSFFRRP